jgi:hypothetical protein
MLLTVWTPRMAILRLWSFAFLGPATHLFWAEHLQLVQQILRVVRRDVELLAATGIVPAG